MKKLFLPVLLVLLCFAYSYQQHKEMKDLIDINVEALTQNEVKQEYSESKRETISRKSLGIVAESEGNYTVLYECFLTTVTVECLGEGDIPCEESVSESEEKQRVL